MSVTTEDREISFSRWLKSALKIQILNDDDTVLDELISFNDLGSIATDSSSYNRRTYSFTLFPSDQGINVGEHCRIWINKQAKVLLGLKTPKMSDYKWYPLGVFVFTDTSSTYNVSENSLTVNCGDRMTQLDGTLNGEVGALTTTIPAYEEDSEGNPTKYNIIRDVLISLMTQLGNVKRYIIDDIGEYKGTTYNSDYASYRISHPQWNCVPYDLEFDVGTNVMSMISEIIELYPNYDIAFDENGVLVSKMIPSCNDDDVILSNSDIQEVLISESVTDDFSNIRNICHVWGQTFDVDWYSETVTNSSSTYIVTMDSYTDYSNGDLIAIKVPSTNSSTQYININSIGKFQIYDEDTDNALSANTLQKNTIYVFKFYKTYSNSTWIKRFYLQGQWQAHGLVALVDGTTSATTHACSDGTTTTLYTKKYFQDVYNVESVSLKKRPKSPYTIQKIGERLSVKSGDVYENITSDSLALSRADYELYKSAILTDNITIVLSSLFPWVKEYMKISYIKKNETELKEYITDKIVLDLQNGTTSITMHTFTQLYE